MTDNENEYFSILRQSVYDRISEGINEKSIDQIVETDLVKSHLDDKVSSEFQNYYFSTLKNEKLYFEATDFFRQFKKQYSLQGIDNNFLDKLEGFKKDILKSIRTDKLAQLYFNTFNKAEIKHGNGFKEKDLGSFFSKLVHTFRPEDYCALDNPIKNYFGLKKESFFISLFIISGEYKHWATDNRQLIISIKDKFEQLDKNKVLNHDHLTDLKLLDLIFWSKANRQ
jgi:hypothetical protein